MTPKRPVLNMHNG